MIWDDFSLKPSLREPVAGADEDDCFSCAIPRFSSLNPLRRCRRENINLLYVAATRAKRVLLGNSLLRLMLHFLIS